MNLGLREQTVRRIAEAANSFLLLSKIANQFGPSPDGAVERDLDAADDRLRKAIRDLPNK